MAKSRVIMKDFTRWQKGVAESDVVFQERMKIVGADVGEYAVRLYERVTRTWDHPVRFTYSLRMLGAILTVDAGTDDQIFNWVDRGTRGPYPITSKGPWPLRFRSGFSPKSRVGSLIARQGRSFGPTVRVMSVTHPGIKARGFTEVVVAQVQPEAEIMMDRDIAVWAARYF